MASTTFTVLTPAITGTTITPKADVGSSQTMTISPTTAQGALDFASLFVRCHNTNSLTTVTLSLAAERFSAKGIGAASVTVGISAITVIGGQIFESARFQNTAGTIVFTQTGTGPTTWEAFQAPRARE